MTCQAMPPETLFLPALALRSHRLAAICQPLASHWPAQRRVVKKRGEKKSVAQRNMAGHLLPGRMREKGVAKCLMMW